MRVLVILVACLIAGCSTTKYERQKIKAERFYNENTNDLAKKCAETYPVKEVFVKGEDKIISDTILRSDTVFVERTLNGKTEYVKVPCPVNKTITKTVYRVDTITVENSAKLASVTGELSKVRDLYEKEKQSLIKSKNTSTVWIWIAIGLFISLVLFILYVVRNRMRLG